MSSSARSRLAATAVTSVLVAALAGPALAGPGVFGYDVPQGPAKVAFADDFPALTDSQWDFALGGWGGLERRAELHHVPVIFVHGNTVDAADWYPVRDDFLEAGWTLQEMYALSYNGLGANNGSSPRRSNPERDAEHREMDWDGAARVTDNDVNVPDLYAFIEAVRDYTGSKRFSLVGHSLGVTLARKTLKVHPELRVDLVAFVGIAGANDGTTLCPPGSEGNVTSCDEIAAGTPWLEELNGPDGSDETYGPARWMTVYDGTGAGDVAFVGPTYAESPLLEGADNRAYPGMDHNGLRMVAEIVADYRSFLEQAETELVLTRTPVEPGTSQPDPGTTGAGSSEDGDAASSDLPATGGGAAALALLALVGAGSLRRRSRPGDLRVGCASTSR